MTRTLNGSSSMKLERSAGGALIAALMLVAVSSIMGATILFAVSTDLQISGNYRRAVNAFYMAEAGIAETAIRLKKSSSNVGYIGPPTSQMHSHWSVYLVSKSGWKPQDDWSYSNQFTNYFPVPGDLTNTGLFLNSVQSTLPYWTKVRYKSEFDAEQAGHTSLTPHYQDHDGIMTAHSQKNRGNVIFYGYTGGEDINPTAFTSENPAPYSPIHIITSQGEVEGSISIIQVEVAHPAGPPLLAPVFVNKEFAFLGGTAKVQGFDRCGILVEGRPPIWLGPEGFLEGKPTVGGNPSRAHTGMKTLNLIEVIDSLNRGAQDFMANLGQVDFGTRERPSLIYADLLKRGMAQSLKMQNVSGFGIILVKGDLKISSTFQWEGLIMVSGKVTFEGGSGHTHIQGGLLADRVQILDGDIAMTLDSCAVSSSLQSLPVSLLSWQQLL